MEKLHLTVNGEEIEAEIKPATTLQNFLYQHVGLTGVKEGCGEGLCGCCTVHVDGIAVKSCIVLAMQVNGKNIRTIEGLAENEENLDPVQEAFLDQGAYQCGFCTPGMIMASRAYLDENPCPSENQVRHALSGNLCRCTGYNKIVKAVLSVGHEKETVSE